MADVDPALGQEILDVSQRQWVRTYIITTRRITSGELLKYRNGLRMPRATTVRGGPKNCSDTTLRSASVRLAAAPVVCGLNGVNIHSTLYCLFSSLIWVRSYRFCTDDRQFFSH